MRIGWVLGTLIVATGCGGEAIIDPPLGGGGSGSSSNNGASSGFGVTVTTSTGGGMMSCEELNAAYRELVQRAKQCNADIDVPQCEDLVPDDLLCPCETSINLDNGEVIQEIGSVVGAFTEQGCLDMPPPCPPVACVEIVAPDCVNDTCVDTP